MNNKIPTVNTVKTVKTVKQSKKKKSRKLNILKAKQTEKTKFGGYPIDLFFGLLFLKQKHRKILGLPFNIRDLISKYQQEIRMGTGISFAGCVIYRCEKSIVGQDIYLSSEPDSESMTANNINTSEPSRRGTSSNNNKKPIYRFNAKDFEVALPNNASHEDFLKLIMRHKTEKKLFMIIPLIFKWTCSKTQTGHANIIFIDLRKMEAERFEPYGKVRKFSKNEQTVADHFDKQMEQLFAKANMTYYKPSEFSPKKGPQYIEEKKIYHQDSNNTSEKETDPEGFCGAWSLWYADLRMSNKTRSRKKLLKKTIKKLQNNDVSLRAFIRNYSKFIINKRKKFLGKLRIGDHHNNLNTYVSKFNSKKTEIEQMLKTEAI